MEQLRAELGPGLDKEANVRAWMNEGGGDPHAALLKVRATRAWEASVGADKLTIADVAPFLRSPHEGQQHPDGCMVLLEDMKGGVARCKAGRPIVLSIGLVHGSIVEIQQQFSYLALRLREHVTEDIPHHQITLVVEAKQREKGAATSFRFPDRNVRSVMKRNEMYYPGSKNSSVHFTCISRVVASMFGVLKPFLPKDVYDKMTLSSSFNKLEAFISPENRLVEWGGLLNFDVDEYVEWRAAQEGIDLASVCARNCGRGFNDEGVSLATLNEIDSASSETLSATALINGENDGWPKPAKYGEVAKRGSGKGYLSTTRWKSKLLMLCGPTLLYFDDPDPQTKKNMVSRTIPLLACKVERIEEESSGSVSARMASVMINRVSNDVSRGSPKFTFLLSNEERDFLFGCDIKEDADNWITAISEQIEKCKKTEID